MADSLFPFGRVTDKGYKNSKQIFNLGLKKDRKLTIFFLENKNENTL